MSYLALYASPFDENNNNGDENNRGDDIDKKRQARNKTL